MTKEKIFDAGQPRGERKMIFIAPPGAPHFLANRKWQERGRPARAFIVSWQASSESSENRPKPEPFRFLPPEFMIGSAGSMLFDNLN
jgi:hypothetical protein